MQENKDENEITRDEIKKEFQLERMILFSDAVFAIVITLMAIEIRLPHTEKGYQPAELTHALIHLLPVILAYCVSFVFIGAIWYQHLKIFSLLKDYDRGLVVRNLALLFFVGLFPFSASVITSAKGADLAFIMYMVIILACITTQYVLYHYIVIKRPALCFNTPMENHLYELKKRKFALIGFSIAAALTITTNLIVSDPLYRPLSTFWLMLFPIIYKFAFKKKKVQNS